jgi:hypothetical protein
MQLDSWGLLSACRSRFGIHNQRRDTLDRAWHEPLRRKYEPPKTEE